MPHVVIVGGGIAGLTAAFFLRDEPVRLTVLEGSSRLGGKLMTSPVGGVAVDQGAESTYAGRPEATELITAAGLGDQIVSPAVTARAIWTRGEIRQLPERQFMGVPSDMEELAKSGLLSSEGLARARQDLELPSAGRDGDISVASYIAGRFGQEVVDRIIDPWLGSVFAGSPEYLSFEATLTPLARASRKYASLAEAARRLLPRPRPGGEKPPTDVATLTGGLGNLPGVLTKAVLRTSPEAVIRTGAMVTELARSQRGWRVTVGPAEHLPADAVSVATQPGLAVCGAAYDGIGIRSCVTTARSAVDQVLASVLTDARAGQEAPALTRAG